MNVSSLTEVSIEPKQEGKGRSFHSTLVAYVAADKFWAAGEGGGRDVERPVYAVFAGSDAEMRPFAANLQLGRRALVPNGYSRRGKGGLEFMRSAGYRHAWQREEEGTILTVYLPDLFLLDPGMVDPTEAKFVLLPSAKWVSEQKLDVKSIVAHARKLPIVKALNTMPKESWRKDNWEAEMPPERLADMVPTAYLFALYLDRRTRAPIPADGRFYLQMMLACLNQGLASWGREENYGNNEKFGYRGGFDFTEIGTEAAGLCKGVAFRATHVQIEALLAAEIELYFKMTKGK